jgi:hypothetical protein
MSSLVSSSAVAASSRSRVQPQRPGHPGFWRPMPARKKPMMLQQPSLLFSACVALLQLPLGALGKGDWSKDPVVNTIPTPADLERLCPEQYAACLQDVDCAGLVQAPTAGQISPLFRVLTQCFDSTPTGVERQEAMAANREKVKRATEDVKCSVCTFVAEDMYSMMMHRPEAKKVSEISVEDTILTLLGNMCRQEGSMGRWRGIYELEACDSELALSTRKNCTQGQQFFLARSPGPSLPTPSKECAACREEVEADYAGREPDEEARHRCDGQCPAQDLKLIADDYETSVIARASEPERGWHSMVYTHVCNDYLLGVDIDIAEAFENVLPPVDSLTDEQVTVFPAFWLLSNCCCAHGWVLLRRLFRLLRRKRQSGLKAVATFAKPGRQRRTRARARRGRRGRRGRRARKQSDDTGLAGLFPLLLG